MSNENTRFIQENIYANFESGNIAVVLEAFDPGIRFTHHGPRDQIPFAGEWHGIEGAREMFATFADTVEPGEEIVSSLTIVPSG
jgi:hypothetical protein